MAGRGDKRLEAKLGLSFLEPGVGMLTCCFYPHSFAELRRKIILWSEWDRDSLHYNERVDLCSWSPRRL
jgi:hypothetical protein